MKPTYAFGGAVLETTCATCGGRGWPTPNDYKRCTDCWGRGKTLTQVGYELLQFMERHMTIDRGRLMIRCPPLKTVQRTNSVEISDADGGSETVL